MIKETVKVVDNPYQSAAKGSAGLRTQLAGKATTVGNLASATGGIGRGQFIERDNK